MGSNPFTYTPGSGGGRPELVFRGQVDTDNSPVYEPVDYDSGKYVAPNSGQYTLMVTGFTEPRKEAIGDDYRKVGGPTERTVTDVEIEIADGKGKGFRFFWSYQTFSLNPGGGRFSASNLGCIYVMAVLDGGIPPKGSVLEFADMLGKPFTAYVTASPERNDKGFPKFAKINGDTIQSVGAVGDADPFEDALAKAS